MICLNYSEWIRLLFFKTFSTEPYNIISRYQSKSRTNSVTPTIENLSKNRSFNASFFAEDSVSTTEVDISSAVSVGWISFDNVVIELVKSGSLIELVVGEFTVVATELMSSSITVGFEVAAVVVGASLLVLSCELVLVLNIVFTVLLVLLVATLEDSNEPTVRVTPAP